MLRPCSFRLTLPAPLVLLALIAPGVRAQGFEPPEAVDVDPSPDVVEVYLEAKQIEWEYFPVTLPGVTTTTWAYGDQTSGVFSVPGPTIRAEKGNLLKVHFTNNLGEPTTIHWHGVDAPADMDGSHIAQFWIQDGESFDYEIPMLDDGMFWYHPHVRTHDQVEKGLHGVLLVRDSSKETQLGLDQMTEHIIVFDDILLDAGLQVVPEFQFGPSEVLERVTYTLNGREGNHLLLNGRAVGERSLTVRNGVPQRWRVVNVANTTFCRLDVQNPVQGLGAQLWEIGADGRPLNTPMLKPSPVTSTWPGLEHPGQSLVNEWGQGIFLMPGERFDVVFTPLGSDGQIFTVLQWDWFRGRHVAEWSAGPGSAIVLKDDPNDGNYPTLPYLDLVLSGDDPGTGEWQPSAAMVALWEQLNPPPDYPVVAEGTLPVRFGHGDPDPATGEVALFAQMKMVGGVMTPLPTAKIDSFEAHDVDVGELWVWEVQNLTHGDHPFHTHGFPFELLEFEWQDDLDPIDPNLNFKFTPLDRRVKDTVRIPARLGAKGTSRCIARLAVHFDETGREGRASAHGSNPTKDPADAWTSGGWLFHCHVLEHANKGMLSWIEVHEPDELFTLLGKQKPGLGQPYPSLTATGDLSPGTDVTLEVVDTLPNKKLWFVVGDYAARRPIAGGELVPGTSPLFANDPFFGVTSGQSDAFGRATWSFDDWGAYPSGTEFFVQVASRDKTAQGGVTFSNALKFVAP